MQLYILQATVLAMAPTGGGDADGAGEADGAGTGEDRANAERPHISIIVDNVLHCAETLRAAHVVRFPRFFCAEVLDVGLAATF